MAHSEVPLSELCLAGKVSGREFIHYDDNGYIRATVTRTKVETEIIFEVQEARRLRPPTLTSLKEDRLGQKQFTFTLATIAWIRPDGVISFGFSEGGDGYLLPQGMDDVPLYA